MRDQSGKDNNMHDGCVDVEVFLGNTLSSPLWLAQRRFVVKAGESVQERRFVCSYIVLVPITRLQSRNLSHSNAVESALYHLYRKLCRSHFLIQITLNLSINSPYLSIQIEVT